HGSLSRHKHHGCDCQLCHSNYRDYENRRYRLRGYGTWQPLAETLRAEQGRRAYSRYGIAGGLTPAERAVLDPTLNPAPA
ncbi:hypothetical protein KBZ21_40505, partial [Streptomyces sp. A73]|nr:hypothetical protein [Streptomyces sp. A73]